MEGKTRDTIWLLLGVLLLFGTMAAFSPGSMFGKAFISLRQNLESAFGGGVGYCPFINPYAMSIYTAGELVVTGNHPLCDPLEYALNQQEGGIEGGDYPVVGAEGTSGGDDLCQGFADGDPVSRVYSVKITTADDTSTIEVECSGSSDDSGCDQLTEEFDPDDFFAHLSALQRGGDLDKGNTVAVQLLTEKRPAWQCFFVFGLLPFFITYYLINDILTFAYLRTNTRRLIAVFASLLAVLTGSFANLIVAVASFVGLSVGQSFLLAIFSLAIFSVFLGQLTATAGVAKGTVEAVQSAVGGMMVLRGLHQVGQQGNENE